MKNAFILLLFSMNMRQETAYSRKNGLPHIHFVLKRIVYLENLNAQINYPLVKNEGSFDKIVVQL